MHDVDAMAMDAYPGVHKQFGHVVVPPTLYVPLVQLTGCKDEPAHRVPAAHGKHGDEVPEQGPGCGIEVEA